MAEAKPDEATIFNVARQIEAPDDRRLYVRQTCGEDPELYARVEALLRVHDEEQSFLESPAEEFHAILGTSVEEGLGAQIGPYKLLQQLGEGGMGTVYLA